MAIPVFQWGSGGVPVTPEQARRQRAVAEALIAQSATPAANWGQGIADLASAYTGTVLNDRAGEAEAAGALEASGLFNGLSSASSEQDIIAAASSPWATDAQRSIAASLLGQQFKVADGLSSGADDPASIREWNIFSAMTPDEQSAYLNMKRSVPYLDIGSGYVRPDPANPGSVLGGEIEKDNYGPAFDKALAGAEGATYAEVKASYDSLASKLPGLESVVEELGTLADKATYTTTGKLWDEVARETGQLPSEGALARTQYISMIDNQVLPLLRDTFGAAFTVEEGNRLRATLGDADKTPAEKKAVLQSFIQQKKRDLEALERRLAGSSAPGTAPASPPPASAGTGWEEVPGMSGVKIRAK